MNIVDYKRLMKAELEQLCKQHFQRDIDVASTVFEDIHVDHDGLLSLFVSRDGELYAFCNTPGPIVFSDVQDIMRQANLEAVEYLAPQGDPSYFERQARDIYMQTFPGLENWSEQEKQYYQTQAVYNPALVRLKPKMGEIRRFVSRIGKWIQAYDASTVAQTLRMHRVKGI